ncbi:hypothetical protein [Sulfitobacter sp. S190]|uniref:hypothetical protein n=1 Tax=Sulfitobacter sp. S190 TaxID=2867022 RepID=UPI0021A6FF5F|nr:hypothetical protein [Sulfitobacter sp. S190]UWR21238.1 hypothetical protein K3756_10970 [Sulfitobacter sp. S190]
MLRLRWRMRFIENFSKGNDCDRSAFIGMKHCIFFLLFAGPVAAQDMGEAIPPATFKIQFDNLQLIIENGVVELTVKQEDLQKILANLPENATIVTPDETDVSGADESENSD